MTKDDEFAPETFFDFGETEHSALFELGQPVWTALGGIGGYLQARLAETTSPAILGNVDPRAILGDSVYIAKEAVVEPNAVIKGPAWIGAGTVIRSGAYLRENVIVGKNCTLGNSSEFKNCLLFNRCEVPHFNYVGDSLLGFRAHLGAGVVCSNVRLDRNSVKVRNSEGERVDTELRKFGAIIGDRTEVGCNSVLNPGTILGRGCVVYPLTTCTGVVEAGRTVRA